MNLLHVLLITVVMLALSCQSSSDRNSNKLTYPETQKTAHVDTYFGEEVSDPYEWLEDDMSEETAAWVVAQNKVAFNYLEDIPFRKKLQERIESLMDYEKISAPFVEGEFEYFYKNDGLQNHAVLYRKPKEAKETDPEVFLDPNAFSEDGTIALRGVFFDKTGDLAAYMITEGGSDWRKIMTIDTKSKEIIGDTIKEVKFSGVSWKGKEGFYYSSYDQPEEGSELSAKTQYHKLYYHTLNTPQEEDELVFGGEAQPNRYVRATVTDDQQYLVVSASENTSGNRLYVKDLKKPSGEFILLQEDYLARCVYIDNIGSTLYLYTNIDAPNYRLIKVDLNRPEVANWEDVIAESENVLRVSTGGGKIFANYLIDAKTAVKQFNMDGTLEREIELPGIGSAFGFSGKKEDNEIYYTFTSFTYPRTIFKYNIANGTSILYQKAAVNFDPEAYETKQVFYESKDGTRVPMFIVHKKGLVLNGRQPTYMYAYGGFNASLTPNFSASRIVWLENGGIYAQPNIRGGGEYGEKWHKAGTRMHKQNVFDDFIAAGEYLIDEKYTSSDYLAIAGGSNGGLLVGAVMTQRPDLARVALPAVGVMDMLKYHTFTAGAGWAADYGTSEESREMFEYIHAYSPYHNLEDGTDYPATLITTSDHDDRVVPAHSFKFAARLQEAHVGNTPVIIRIQTNAGHGSVSMSQRIALTTDIYAFTWHNMGVQPSLVVEEQIAEN